LGDRKIFRPGNENDAEGVFHSDPIDGIDDFDHGLYVIKTALTCISSSPQMLLRIA